jgi:hypothetical protein
MVVVHALVWIKISPVAHPDTDVEPGEPGARGESGAEPGKRVDFAGLGDSWRGQPGKGTQGSEHPQTMVKIIRSSGFLLLEGSVPGVADRSRVEQAVRRAEPEKQIRNRIRIEPGASAAVWLAEFADWWPRLGERVSAPELDAWTDPPVCRFWGEVPSEGDVERVRNDFGALVGAGTEVDCAGLRWSRNADGAVPGGESEAGGTGAWAMAVVMNDGVLVAGRVEDETLPERLESALSGRGGKLDLRDLRVVRGMEKEAWVATYPDVVRTLAALSGDGVLEIRQGEAWLAARVRSSEDGGALERATRDLLEGRLRVRTETFSGDGARSGGESTNGGTTVYFGVGKAELPDSERRKIEGFSQGLESREDGGVLRCIGYASGGVDAEADGLLAKQRAEAVLGELPPSVRERFRPEIETRRPAWGGGGGVVFRQDQRVEVEVLRLQ